MQKSEHGQAKSEKKSRESTVGWSAGLLTGPENQVGSKACRSAGKEVERKKVMKGKGGRERERERTKGRRRRRVERGKRRTGGEARGSTKAWTRKRKKERKKKSEPKIRPKTHRAPVPVCPGGPDLQHGQNGQQK